ncbi:hypothetical protein RHMOL_Rhmol04G0128200 [Rhododendron molle]|uniref:Uncharacterized protein n=1 Tax=Rhododendron molle TaxID=49168 RepID=A0ACC0P114_RHOML|nr:hypothetical protein RHMOL_Rhmol04G0128200 [Rhododendron molle]
MEKTPLSSPFSPFHPKGLLIKDGASSDNGFLNLSIITVPLSLTLKRMPTTMEVEKARFYYGMRNTVVTVECSYEGQPPLKLDFDINYKEQSSCAKLVDHFASKEKTGVLTKRFGGVFIDQQGATS